MKKWTAVLLVGILLMAFAAAASAATTYYCTSRRLNVRRGPGTDYDVCGSVSYGDKVEVRQIDHGWALIDYHYEDDDFDYYAAWVSTKCISRTKPTGGYEYASQTSSGNSDYRNFVTADYNVVVNPTNNYVNMRWEASKTSPVRRVYYYGSRLHVIAENANWCQVRDETTGEVGFMLKSLLLRTYDEIPATGNVGAAENG